MTKKTPSSPLPETISIRAPGSLDFRIAPPSPAWLSAGPWFVTYSSLPLWKSKRNVRIGYKVLSLPHETEVRLDDLIEYQGIASDKIKAIRGTDKASESPFAWDWRGSGWLFIASSHWEILGYGLLKGAGSKGSDLEWAVTYFEKTLFTPAGIDIYTRPEARVPEGALAEIKAKLKESGGTLLGKQVDELFAVKHDL